MEIHGAHGYIVVQFGPEINQRDDEFGEVSRTGLLLFDIIDGIRKVWS